MFHLRSLTSGAAALAYWSGVAGGARRSSEGARVVAFHGTPQSRAHELERQLRYLQRQFTVVSVAELLRRMDSAPERLGGVLAITFDDGLRNNLTVAYPILKRLGLPATLFLCPGLIGRGQWLWNCEARQRLHHAAPAARRELAGRYGIEPDAESFVAWMKTLDAAARHAVEDEIRSATPDYVPSARERHELDLAGWDELRSLEPSLIELASHTMHHPILTCITAQQVHSELRDSRQMLEEQLQRPVETLAYPNGDQNELVRDIARQYYRAAFISDSQELVESSAGCHAIPRFCAPAGALRLALVANRLKRPATRSDRAQPAEDDVTVCRRDRPAALRGAR